MENLFDNLKKGMSIALNEAEKLTKVVKDKTVNIYDTTKLNLALNSTEGKMNKHFQKIGEIIYQQQKDNRNVGEELEAYCEEIDSFVSEINELKSRIAELKNSSVCPSCGNPTDKSGDFCSKCGVRISDEDDVIQVVDVPDECKTASVVDTVDVVDVVE